GPGTPNTLHNNEIVGNGVGVDGTAPNPSDPAIDATGNWWGCVAGPGNPGCDSVAGHVNAGSPSAAPPACVNCTTNAQCSHGVTGNGVETCNLSTHHCQAGTPPNCNGLSDQCNVGTCTEPAGSCTAVPKPNGTACSSGDTCSIPDTCQSGTCVAGGGGDTDGDGLCNADD